MEFLLADILIPTIDFIWNGIEWVLAILFGTGGSVSIATLFVSGAPSVGGSSDTVSLSEFNKSKAPKPVKNAPTTTAAPDETFMQQALDTVSPGANQIVKDSAPLRFPLSLASEGSGMRPLIRFTCFEREDDNLNRKTCYFPCPANIAFADNANLGTIDLGMLGAAVNDAFNSQAGTTGSGVGNLTDPISTSGAITKLLGKTSDLIGVGGQTLTNVKFGLKTVENPYQNTTYSGAGVRTFTFNFKMIAEKPEDAIEIKKIHEFFRTNMYAGRVGGRESSSSALLKYPSVWEIDFLTGITDKGITPNKFLPAIYASYLQNFNATFNTTAPTWYKDGAPLEVDISMTYQEARALERNDVENLSRITAINESGELVNPTLAYDQIADKGITNKGTARATGINYGDYAIKTEQSNGGNGGNSRNAGVASQR